MAPEKLEENSVWLHHPLWQKSKIFPFLLTSKVSLIPLMAELSDEKTQDVLVVKDLEVTVEESAKSETPQAG